MRNFLRSRIIVRAAAAAAKSLQSYPTLCDPIDGSPSGSPVPGILWARTLEWVAISFSKAWKWKVKGKSLSRVRLLATPWTAAYQAPPSMGFSRQEYWSGVPLPSLYVCNHKWIHILQLELDFMSYAGACTATSCSEFLYLILCDLMDCSLPGFSLRGISQARILRGEPFPSPGGSSWPRDRIRVSCTAGRK